MSNDDDIIIRGKHKIAAAVTKVTEIVKANKWTVAVAVIAFVAGALIF